MALHPIPSTIARVHAGFDIRIIREGAGGLGFRLVQEYDIYVAPRS
jgi:hypothetical protein